MSTTTTATRPAAAPTAPATTALIAPQQPDDATKSWRRMITAVDPSKTGAYALTGPWLNCGTAYELPLGAVVVTCDRYPDRWEVRMHRVDVGELTPVKEWTLKNALGKRVTDWIGRRLPAGAAQHTARRLDVLPNRWPGRCTKCRRPVDAGEGRVVDLGTRNGVVHHPGQCPPPPEVITPNLYAGTCFACGNWVEPNTGVAVRRESPSEATGGRYHPMHTAPCPLDAAPGPRNRAADWCADCGELVPAGSGYRLDGAAHHRGACPARRQGPTWVIRRGKRDRMEAGGVGRVRVDLRTGVSVVEARDSLHDWSYRRRGGSEVPPSVPGYRVFGEQYVELVAVAVECVDRGRGRQLVRVRPASWAEAEGLLAEDVARALDVRPAGGGFMARWSAERIGDCQPWLAEITGRDPDFGWRREFERPDRDYARSNSKGTRGVWFHYTLAPNRVYEVQYPLSHRHVVRKFLRATVEGDVAEIGKEEVEAWLNASPVWHAS